MSLWIDTPEILDRVTQASRLRFKDSHWPLDRADWICDHRVRRQLRKYPGNRDPSQIDVLIDLDADEAAIGGGARIAIAALEAALEQELLRRPLVELGRLPG